MKYLKLFQIISTSGMIVTTATFGSFITRVQAATFSLPIESAAEATGIDILRDHYNLDGEGVTIGVISDSFAIAETFDASGNLDTYTTNIADGYLPSGVNVLKDSTNPNATDEGRALLQIIHAIAPEANLAFHTDGFGVSNFGQAIQALSEVGADIIVDDVGYGYPPNAPPNAPLDLFDLEPPEGFINQAIDTAYSQGISYFTEAGNDFPDIPIYGHGNNPNALTVGAVYYGNAESYSNQSYDLIVEQGQLEPFSSEGNTNLLKPDVVAPDALPISFDLGGGSPRIANTPDYFDFFGTSASAPFAAATAALLLQADPDATPAEIYDALRDTADSPVPDFDSRLGFGLIQADKAITALDVEPLPNSETVPEPSATLVLIFAGISVFSLGAKHPRKN